MGKAKLLTHLGNGLYSVEIDAGHDLRTKRVAGIDKRLAEIAAELASLQVMLNEARAALNQAKTEADSAIDELVSLQGQEDVTTEQLIEASDKASKAVEKAIKANEPVQRFEILMKPLEADQMQLNKEKAQLQGLQLKRTVQAWCADFTEDKTGDAATIEIPGEPTALLVAPAGRAPTPGDGQLLARAMMSPEQAFYNAAILPGWQRFKPDYRKGTVTFLDKENDKANVLLDEAVSTAQSLPVTRKNASLLLTAVPVEYMNCDSLAFEEGDRVVVQFTGRDWDNPKVIGFVDNPKPCIPMFVLVPLRLKDTNPWSGSSQYRVHPYGIFQTDYVCATNLNGTKTKGSGQDFVNSTTTLEIVLQNEVFAPDGLLGLVADPVPATSYWSAVEGVSTYRHSTNPPPGYPAVTSWSTTTPVAYDIGQPSWAGTFVRRVTLMVPSPQSLMEGYTVIGNEVEGCSSDPYFETWPTYPIAEGPVLEDTYLLNSTNPATIAGFFGIGTGPDIKLRSPETGREFVYKFAGLDGKAEWGSPLWARFEFEPTEPTA